MRKEAERSFEFLPVNERNGKPRRTGVTEIRGPYYSPLGKRMLLDTLETMGGVHRYPEIRRGLLRSDAVADERGNRPRLDSVVNAVRNLEKISVRNLAMHLV